MKKVLLASTALVMSAGVAAADVSVGGDGRMGMIEAFGSDDLVFTSRIRISFSASGETDAGLAFGGSIRADNASPGGTAGQAGSVFVEGSFGKLSMGDVDGAAKAAVGHVSGVGLTGLSDMNESTYIANGNDDPTALYEYSAGDLGFLVSLGQRADATEEMAVGLTYSAGNVSFALGYEDADLADEHVIGAVSAAFGDATVKAIYGESGGNSQYAVSLDFVSGATTFTVFYTDDEDLGGAEAMGLGVAYDLGGGASIKAGYASDETADDSAYDFGISMSF